MSNRPHSRVCLFTRHGTRAGRDFSSCLASCTNAGESSGDVSLEGKVGWLRQHERQLNWVTCIRPALENVLPLVAWEKEVLGHYEELWQTLNKYVHPSVDLVSRMVGESALMVTDGVDETWATEILQDATEVFDLIWLAKISQFPRCARLLAQQEYGLSCPLTQSVLKRMWSAD
ncbi:MAG: hypothetical protein AB7P69_13750 [Candidatus Binatia bacterium]